MMLVLLTGCGKEDEKEKFINLLSSYISEETYLNNKTFPAEAEKFRTELYSTSAEGYLSNILCDLNNDNKYDGLSFYYTNGTIDAYLLGMQNYEYKLKYINLHEIEDSTFLHYTSIKNLDSISINGLQPQIGKNSKIIEKTPKIFFTAGEKGALVIMDSWIKWLVAKPKSNFVYYIGAFLLKVPFFPKIIHKIIMNINKNKKKYKWSYKSLKEILDNSVYLVLNLEENKDFRYDDVDEVKQLSNYPISFIKNLYAYDSDVYDGKIEYWNMHTLSNKTIEPQKIHILRFKNKTKASDILKILIEKNMEFVKKNCNLLYRYYSYNYLESDEENENRCRYR